MGIIFELAVDWRVTRINALRRELAATPRPFVSQREKLKVDIAFERAELALLYRTGSVRGSAAPRVA